MEWEPERCCCRELIDVEGGEGRQNTADMRLQVDGAAVDR